MTKLTNGKTITIKINGQNRPFHEESAKIELGISEDSKQETLKHSESLTTNQAHEEAAAAKELPDESFEWILPESEPLQIESSDAPQDHTSHHPQKTGKKNLGGLKPIIFSVIFAVIIGTTLGIVMLKLVIKDYRKSASVVTPAPQTVEKNPSADEKEPAPAVLKSWTSYVVQGGAYSSQNSAAAAAKQAGKSGIPAQDFVINGQHFLFLGVADSSENARKLKSAYQNIDGIFSKSITIPEKKFTNITENERLFLKDAASLFPILTKSTSDSEFISANPKEILSTITSLESTIKNMDDQELKNKKLIELKTEITAASEQVKAYLKKKDHSTLLKAQQHLLTFLSIYYSF